VKIKQVIVTKDPDGTQVDITKPFTDFLKENGGVPDGFTMDFTKKDHYGSIC
jgi:hypothetical protein